MDMVERVARAMCAETGTIWGGPRGEDDPDFLLMKVTYLSLARTAIAAMREPDDGMIEAVAQHEVDIGICFAAFEQIPWADAWPVAIDAALGIKKTPA